MRCHLCYTANPDGHRICYSCGASIAPPQAGDLGGLVVVEILRAFSSWTNSLAARRATDKADKIENVIEEAIKELGKGRYQEVLKLMQRSGITGDFPPDYRAWSHFLCGEAYLGLEDNRSARTHFTQLLAIPGISESFCCPKAMQYLLLGVTWHNEWATSNTVPNAILSEALDCFNNAVHYDPTNSLILYSRGRTLGDAGRDREALSDLTRAIQLRSTDADFYAYRGLLYGKLGQLSKSLDDAEKALRLDANNMLAEKVSILARRGLGR